MWRYEATNGHITEITKFFFCHLAFLHQANCIDPMGDVSEFISLMNFNSLSLQRLYCFLHTIWPSSLLFYMHWVCCAVLCVCASKELHIYHFNVYIYCAQKTDFATLFRKWWRLSDELRWAHVVLKLNIHCFHLLVYISTFICTVIDRSSAVPGFHRFFFSRLSTAITQHSKCCDVCILFLCGWRA